MSASQIPRHTAFWRIGLLRIVIFVLTYTRKASNQVSFTTTSFIFIHTFIYKVHHPLLQTDRQAETEIQIILWDCDTRQTDSKDRQRDRHKLTSLFLLSIKRRKDDRTIKLQCACFFSSRLNKMHQFPSLTSLTLHIHIHTLQCS